MTAPTAPAEMPNVIPQSSALAEASPESLSVLMSFDPEGEKFAAALPQIVAALRAQRARFAQTEAEKSSGKAKGAKPAKVTLSTVIPQNVELDF